MPLLQIDEDALEDLRRLKNFLLPKNRQIADRAIETITNYMIKLKKSPCIGVFYREFKALTVPFGKSNYVIFYIYIEADDCVRILRVKHGREDLDHPEHGHS